MNYLRAPRCLPPYHNKRKSIHGMATYVSCPFFCPAAPIKKLVRDWIDRQEKARLNNSHKNGVEPGATTLEVLSIHVAEMLGQKPDSVKRNLIRREHRILRADTADALLCAIGETFHTVDIPVLPCDWDAAQEMVDAYEFARGEKLDKYIAFITAEELLAVSHILTKDPTARPAVAPLVAHITGGDFPVREEAPAMPAEPTLDSIQADEIMADLFEAA